MRRPPLAPLIFLPALLACDDGPGGGRIPQPTLEGWTPKHQRIVVGESAEVSCRVIWPDGRKPDWVSIGTLYDWPYVADPSKEVFYDGDVIRVRWTPWEAGVAVFEGNVTFYQTNAQYNGITAAAPVTASITAHPRTRRWLRLPDGRLALVRQFFTEPVGDRAAVVTTADGLAFTPPAWLRPQGGAAQPVRDAAVTPEGDLVVIMADSGTFSAQHQTHPDDLVLRFTP